MNSKTRPFDWFNANLDAWTLAIETPSVIVLRLAKFMSGKDPSGREARLMITEKADALLKLQWALITGKFGKNPVLAAQKGLRFAATAVEANRRRLT